VKDNWLLGANNFSDVGKSTTDPDIYKIRTKQRDISYIPFL